MSNISEDKMWRTVLIVCLVCFHETRAGGRGSSHPEGKTNSNKCDDVISACQNTGLPWTGCYEDMIATCELPQVRVGPPFIRMRVNSSQEILLLNALDLIGPEKVGGALKAVLDTPGFARYESSYQFEVPFNQHRVHIPAMALQRSMGAAVTDGEVLLVATLIDSSNFKLSKPRRGQSRGRIQPRRPSRKDGEVMGGLVLVVRAGTKPVTNLSQPVRLTFLHNEQVFQVDAGTCVFWYEAADGDGTGYWSTDGCETNNTGSESICSCNHMSFFAVLVNPELSVDKRSADNLSYITYVGSALSVFFTIISLIIYICQHRRRPEKAIGVHMHLTGALFCLHLSFLLCCFWAWRLGGEEQEKGGWVCQGLGLVLHWSLLATFTWTALEGFHLYLLLVRVFNIYVRRYLLKLSVVGWGLPTLTAVVCGISGVYGKYRLKLKDGNARNSTAAICWISSDFQQQQLVVSYITTVALPCLVILWNSCMLGLVVFRMWGLRRQKMDRENRSRLWKDCATVLGLSWVLGLPWALASVTYVSLPGIYVFTILNCLQGVFVFLWSFALSCKSRSDISSSKDPSSSQKMITTSFNN